MIGIKKLRYELIQISLHVGKVNDTSMRILPL